MCPAYLATAATVQVDLPWPLYRHSGDEPETSA